MSANGTKTKRALTPLRSKFTNELQEQRRLIRKEIDDQLEIEKERRMKLESQGIPLDGRDKVGEWLYVEGRIRSAVDEECRTGRLTDDTRTEMKKVLADHFEDSTMWRNKHGERNIGSGEIIYEILVDLLPHNDDIREEMSSYVGIDKGDINSYKQYLLKHRKEIEALSEAILAKLIIHYDFADDLIQPRHITGILLGNREYTDQKLSYIFGDLRDMLLKLPKAETLEVSLKNTSPATS